MILRRVLSGFALAATTAMAAATVPGTASAQTLEDALIAAYSNNPTLLSARADLRATDEQVPQALADWRPLVELTADYGTEFNRNTLTPEPDEAQNRNPANVGLTITQSLFRGGQTAAATEEAENVVRSERALLLAQEQEILLEAATAYLNVFRDEAILRLNVNNERVLQRQLDATRDRFEVGEITRTDVHQAQARLSGATADRTEAEADLEASRAAYENVIGQPAPVDLVLPSPPKGLPTTREDAIRLAATRNPEVISAEFERQAAEANVKEVRGQLLPELSIIGSANRSFEALAEEGVLDTAEVIFSLNVPIYQQGLVYSELREAKQLVAVAIQDIDQARRDAVEDATSAFEDLLQARARVDSFKTQVDANIVALDGVQREAAVGSRTVLDILDAEQELLDSRVGNAEAQRDEMVAAYEVLEAIGRLTAQDQELPVELYDPTEHYREVRTKLFGGNSEGQAEGLGILDSLR